MSKCGIKKITIDGIDYVEAGSKPAKEKDGLRYVIVRTYSAGVFAGYLKERNGKEAVMVDVRRLWYWSGAASLSQLAMEGTKNPGECKFAMPMDRDELTEVIEVIDVTEEAQGSINAVPVWKM